jgi:hypothetical protein
MKISLIVLIAAVVCAAAGCAVSFHVFQIEAVREQKVVFLSIVKPGERFATKYIHSVEKSPVWEYFVVDRKYRIVLEETTFSSCNTGLPSVVDNESFHHEGERFRISHMNRILPALVWWVHEMYDNTLKIGESQELKLAALAGNTLVKISIEKVRLFEFIFTKLRLLVQGRR